MKLSQRYSLGMKLSIGQGLLILILMAAFTVVITVVTSRKATEESQRALASQAQSVVDAMVSYNGALTDSAGNWRQSSAPILAVPLPLIVQAV